MSEPTDATLQQRCAEIVEWQRTGMLTGKALRDYAAQRWPQHHDALQMAERETSARVMELIAKWGTPPAVVGEPVAWLHDCAALLTNDVELWINACPHCGKPRTPPHPTQAQAGAVPLTPDQVAEIADAAHREYDRLVSSGQCAPRWSAVFAHLLERAHGISIKGGQHGTE